MLILDKAPHHAAVLLANYGRVVSASSFEAAMFADREGAVFRWKDFKCALA